MQFAATGSGAGGEPSNSSACRLERPRGPKASRSHPSIAFICISLEFVVRYAGYYRTHRVAPGQGLHTTRMCMVKILKISSIPVLSKINRWTLQAAQFVGDEAIATPGAAQTPPHMRLLARQVHSIAVSFHLTVLPLRSCSPLGSGARTLPRINLRTVAVRGFCTA
jgi:hypothetical protein